MELGWNFIFFRAKIGNKDYCIIFFGENECIRWISAILFAVRAAAAAAATGGVLYSSSSERQRFHVCVVCRACMMMVVLAAGLMASFFSTRRNSCEGPPVDAQSPSSFVVESSLLTAQFPPRKPRLRRSVARGGACLRARASRLSIAAPLLPKKTHESWVTMPNAPRTTQLCRHGFAATRSSKKESLLEGESGLTPTKKTPPTRYKPVRACLAACLTEAARGTEQCTRYGALGYKRKKKGSNGPHISVRNS